MATTFVKLTRVYVKKGERTVREQNVVIAREAIAMVRPSNRLGYPEHRSSITLVSGDVIDVKDKYSVVLTALGIR